jgi:hypothetical protein
MFELGSPAWSKTFQRLSYRIRPVTPGHEFCTKCEEEAKQEIYGEDAYDLPSDIEPPHAPTEPRECSICRGFHGRETEHPCE